MANSVLADMFGSSSMGSRQGPGPQLSKPDVFGSSPVVKKKKPKKSAYLNQDDDEDDEE